jgi:hypothetical protein
LSLLHSFQGFVKQAIKIKDYTLQALQTFLASQALRQQVNYLF